MIWKISALAKLTYFKQKCLLGDSNPASVTEWAKLSVIDKIVIPQSSYGTIFLILRSSTGQHSGAVISTAANPGPGIFLSGVWMFSVCLHGFSPCPPASSRSPNMHVRSIVCECELLFFSLWPLLGPGNLSRVYHAFTLSQRPMTLSSGTSGSKNTSYAYCLTFHIMWQFRGEKKKFFRLSGILVHLNYLNLP